jgi:hypothetical protein
LPLRGAHGVGGGGGLSWPHHSYSLCDLDNSQKGRVLLPAGCIATEARGGPPMTPLRTATLVVLFSLAALSAVATLVDSYNRGAGLQVSTLMEQGRHP